MGKPQLNSAKFQNVHPKSRKAKQLSKKLTREAKMVKKKAVSNMRLQILGEKLSWFRENFDSTIECYSTAQIHELIQRYIDRNLEELETINLKNSVGHRKSRQHASREDLITICRENETTEFASTGFETVDLTNKENMNYFKTWNGELKLLPNIKLKKFVKSSGSRLPEKCEDKMIVDSR